MVQADVFLRVLLRFSAVAPPLFGILARQSFLKENLGG